MPRVLIIAHHFPPAGTGGVGRATSWARHLPGLGWHSTILAAEPAPGWPRDETLLDQIPESVVVKRVPAADPRPPRWRGFQQRELGFLWQRPALAAGRRLLRAQPCDVILATAPPPAAHVVAAALSRDFGIPWVADFRDPWKVRAPSGWRRRRRQVVARTAAARVAVNDALRAHLEAELRLPAVTVFNGFEPDEMPSAADQVARTVVYLGTLSAVNDFDALFRALAAHGGHFVHVGASRRYDLAARTRVAGLSQVTALGYLGRREALMRAARASVCTLSLRPGLELTVPTKLFDYVGLGGPVLCIGDRGAAADFVRRHEGLGLCAPAGDADAIGRALEELWRCGSAFSPERRAPYARVRLAESLSRILHQACEAPRP